ncbi:MAG: ComF family protein [Candidatus Pacebacteria bacterium]|nr:ComF family protein [Candidatus Paceibacterota bacterium]
MEYLKQFWDLIFPKKCINCKKEGSYLCEDCLSLKEINPYRYCLCERMEKKDKCDVCKNRYLDKLFSAASFENRILKEAVHKFKYGYIKDLSHPLSILILSHLQILEVNLDQSVIIIPVPMTDKKKRRRGFNQSEEMAKIISRATGIPLLSDVLIKNKETAPQMELNKKERMENIKKCFEIKNQEKIKGKTILLLDDVYTTGSTMEECAKKLKQSGAAKVWGMTIAREVDQKAYFV